MLAAAHVRASLECDCSHTASASQVLEDIGLAIHNCETTITSCIRELNSRLKVVTLLYSQGMSGGACSAEVLERMKSHLARCAAGVGRSQEKAWRMSAWRL